MSRLGAMPYCTEEGGSGYMTTPSQPWLSTYDITQMSPVFDQDIGWLRNSSPNSFTNYPSLDSGLDMVPAPQPLNCGMGYMDPAVFEQHYGRPAPDPNVCLQIQCGAISQDAAGPQLIMDCMDAGYSAVRSCIDPACAPFLASMPQCLKPAPTNLVLRRADVVAQMPSITETVRNGCKQTVQSCPSAVESWLTNNPCLAIVLALGAGYLLFSNGGKR